MSDDISKRLKWLGDHLAKYAEAEGIGQGSEGARICWEGKAEIERLSTMGKDTELRLSQATSEINRLAAENAELVSALLEISQVACSMSPEQKISNAILAKVKEK